MIADVLAAARARIERYTPAQAMAADGAVLVDVRCGEVRARAGIVPGSVHVPRSVLEWRCGPASGYANPSSSLAAASLRELGVDAGDLEGGFAAWTAAGLPVADAPPPRTGLPGMGGPE